ncbi:MAG: MraY family glycosyltransferase [Bacteroidota bacterium]
MFFCWGVRDDLVPFRALHKLYGQIIAVVIFSFSSIQIGSFYGLFGIETIWTPLAYIITGFTIIVITNSFNLIDGLDGLAGSISLIALIAFGVWFFMADDYVFALLSFCMTGGLLAFMVFNWEPSEIFMGDTGAMVIGMLLAVLAIRFLNINDTLPVDSALKYKAPIAGAISFLIIPIADTIRIIILRVSRGQSPFTPDKSHIHHAIMRLGMTHSQTAIILATVNVLFLAVVFAFRDYPDGYVILCVAVFGAAMSFVLDRLITRKVQAKAS